ncbi:MAG: nucleoside monophosphate kinase, partial [Alphaproteobacteria bacterium]|nr:nucleoside monophosphate kinase [Alphaproteobacteria bacterium]
PGNINQAEILESMNLKIDKVICLETEDKVIVERMSGRKICPVCGAMYHDTLKPTKVFGKCDDCGGANFLRRQDDNWQTVVDRLKTYRMMTTPVLPYYQHEGLLETIDGTGGVEEVAEKLKKIIGF